MLTHLLRMLDHMLLHRISILIRLFHGQHFIVRVLGRCRQLVVWDFTEVPVMRELGLAVLTTRDRSGT